MYNDDKNKFKEWFRSFIQKHEGYSPLSYDKWFEEVEANHTNIRSFFKGVRYEKNIQMQNEQKDLSLEEVEDISKKIKKICPRFFDVFTNNIGILMSPYIRNGSHNTQKTTKALARRIRSLDLSSTETKVINSLLSELGQVWNKNKTQQLDLHVTLSTAAKGFALLGHLGPDIDSCFRQRSDHTRDKYVLGQSKDTFLVYIKGFDKIKQKHLCLGRAIGWFDESNKSFSVINYYSKPDLTEGTFLGILSECFTDILIDNNELEKEKSLSIHDVQYEIHGSFYRNPHGQWLFLKDTNEEVNLLKKMNGKNLTHWTCEKCLKHISIDYDKIEIDEITVCGSCYQNTNQCQFSKIRTFESLVFAYLDKEKIEIHQGLVSNNTFVKCGDCDKYVLNKSTTKLRNYNKNVCEECIEEYVKCDISNDFMPKTENVCLFEFNFNQQSLFKHDSPYKFFSKNQIIVLKTILKEEDTNEV